MGNGTLQRNFEGYLNTPLLWKAADVFGLQQCEFKHNKFENFTPKGPEQLRLGKLVEQFVFQQLELDPAYIILAENIQVQDGKRTIGELDALLLYGNKPIHLEIIYKFYLYDPNESTSELAHWIGPNRKDSLLHKLDKLKEKQLPLLYHPKTQLLLADLGLTVTEINQQVLFKAQLFLPLDHPNTIFPQINPKCVKGFYLKIAELERFKTRQFFIPEKIDWLMESHEQVHWIDYESFLFQVNHWLDKKISPLCWLKHQGAHSKFFVVWW